MGGHVATDADKARAGQIAQSIATTQVVAMRWYRYLRSIRTVFSDLDKGIDNNLDAALISGGFRTGIHHSVKNGVVTLTGVVDTENERGQIQSIAKGVPNTQQVVNEIQTRHQKATSTK